jgi:23S rRNA (pseudouridine1915-N3)-methyltransferase
MQVTMGQIHIHAYGKMKDRHLMSLCEDYLERISRCCRVSVIEHRKPKKSIAHVKSRSWRKSPSKIFGRRDDMVIFLDDSGEQMTSDRFAEMLRMYLEMRGVDIHFVVGDPFGFATANSEMADRRISLSRFTLPYQLARVVLLEQIYRAFTILRKEPYHK